MEVRSLRMRVRFPLRTSIVPRDCTRIAPGRRTVSDILVHSLESSGTFPMHLRIMTEQDVPDGVRLNSLSGWNQVDADWKRFLSSSPRGCFVMEHDGKVVGTATTICYENRFAWIGMVLVDPDYRKQGIGTQLLKRTIDYLDQVHIVTM